MRNLIDAINDLRKLDNELKSGRVWTPADSKRISRAIRAMEAAAKRLVWAPVGSRIRFARLAGRRKGRQARRIHGGRVVAKAKSEVEISVATKPVK